MPKITEQPEESFIDPHMICRGNLNYTLGMNVCRVERDLIKREARKRNMSISEFLRYKITGNRFDLGDAIVSEE